MGHERVHVVAGVNLTDEAAVTSFYSGLPGLWASVHSAGGFAMSPAAQTPLAEFRQMIDTNAVTCFLCCREAIRRIRATGNDGGRIVNVAARPALVPTGGLAAYAASKAAVAGLTLSLAEELAGDRIWVNAVRPLDDGHPGQPPGHAQGGLRPLAEGGGGCGDDRVPRLAAERGDAQGAGAGVRAVVIYGRAGSP